MQYEPNKPVLRPTVEPDSTKDARLEHERRAKREVRTNANKQLTIDRLEEERVMELISLDQKRREGAEVS